VSFGFQKLACGSNRLGAGGGNLRRMTYPSCSRSLLRWWFPAVCGVAASVLALGGLGTSALGAEGSQPAAPAAVAAREGDLFRKENLAAWCIVPFDKAKRSPEQRAEMLSRMGVRKLAYDWRQEHVPQFEQEVQACQKQGIEYFAFWGTHDAAFELFEKHGLHPQVWVTMGSSKTEQDEKVKEAAERLLPVVAKAKRFGGSVGIYNHGSWGGEPENMVAVCEYLKREHQVNNVGIVYNLHHGHGHLERLSAAFAQMLPHLICVNLNGMDVAGDQHGRKILPLGVGTEDLAVLRTIRDSGYRGTVGIINHTGADAEERLLDNLDGLEWLKGQLHGGPAGTPVTYRTWKAPVPVAASQPAATK
jgi:hypothetical protein